MFSCLCLAGDIAVCVLAWIVTSSIVLNSGGSDCAICRWYCRHDLYVGIIVPYVWIDGPGYLYAGYNIGGKIRDKLGIE